VEDAAEDEGDEMVDNVEDGLDPDDHYRRDAAGKRVSCESTGK